MSLIDDLFTRLRANDHKALMPFLTAGDPDLEFTADAIRAFQAAGCHLCEVGVPYSDPIADGPVIQASYTRALENRIRLNDIFATAAKIKSEMSMPLVTMVSYAIVFRKGVEQFIDRAQEAGFSGAIIPDLLVEEAERIAPLFAARDFSLVQLVTPTTSRERAVRIASCSTGFIYYVSVTGITGERTTLPAKLVDNVGWLREQIDLPVCIGFGISTPDHIRMLAPVSDGLIVGSAIVRRLQSANSTNRADILSDVSTYVSELCDALNPHNA